MRALLPFLLLMSFVVKSQTLSEKARLLYEAKKYTEVVTLLKPVDEDDDNYAVAQYYLGRAAFDQKTLMMRQTILRKPRKQKTDRQPFITIGWATPTAPLPRMPTCCGRVSLPPK